MKIEDLESLLISIDGLSQPVCILRVRTDTGLTGIGQTACWGYPEAVSQILSKFKRYLVGKDPFQVEHHWQAMYRMFPFRGSVLSGAVSAVDIALWDIKGKHFQTPVWELMGGKCRDKIRLHLLLQGGSTPEEVALSARAAAEEGFTALKFDPLPMGYQDMSHARLISTAVDQVSAAREAVGDDVDLIIEIHRKLTPMVAVVLAEALSDFHPLFYEDPIQIDSILSQAEIAKRVTLPVANGERMHNIWEFRELLSSGGPQFVRPDVGLAGGLTHCKKIAAIAEAYHSAVVTHNYLGPILTAASIHLDACIPNFVVQEYSKNDENPKNKVYQTAFHRKGGYMSLPEEPGLGVILDEELLTDIKCPQESDTYPLLRKDGSIAASG